ncbi:hypothetical protein CEXT_217521 [Caerostris extrusa]|uniref:Uncharacterized protein n=1 Tax=Caerostris extrusa TaxID=172846 RepID=A0AAV4N115_CAEEX|nr:hypothetical protein CEXT_217521 [Caerostris extrusa]
MLLLVICLAFFMVRHADRSRDLFGFVKQSVPDSCSQYQHNIMHIVVIIVSYFLVRQVIVSNAMTGSIVIAVLLRFIVPVLHVRPRHMWLPPDAILSSHSNYNAILSLGRRS